MSGPYQYYNTLDNKVSATLPINFCLTMGPMSFCRACTMADQHGCKYREESSYDKDCCMYYRSDMNGACDNSWAHSGRQKPKAEEEKSKSDTIVHQAVPV